jgi:serine/threonine protein kinase
MEIETICVNCMEDDSGGPICPKCGSPFNPPVNNLLLLPPRTILREQYLIGRALGHGGFGITYLAWDIGLQTRLAVKEYMPAGVAARTERTKVAPLTDSARQEYEWGLERFLEEARVLKKSNHPNIVTVDTVFRDNGTAYLVMEYLDGVNFAEFLALRGRTIPFADALRVMSPVMDALIAVHALDIVHRDVSPDNIFIPKLGKIKLIDFGAARNALSQKSRNLSAILKGGYAPEEQYRSSGNQGPWTDVYATAATFYRAITGKVPLSSLDRQAEDTLERPSQLGVAIPPSAESALMKAMAVRAHDRFQSMEDFKRALTGGVSVPQAAFVTLPGEGPSAPPVPPVSGLEAKIRKYETPAPEPPPPAAVARDQAARRPSPRWLLPAILAGLLVLAAGGGVLLLKHWRSPITPGPALTEWPAQSTGIPQTDLERQQQLEAQPGQNPATPPAPAAPDMAQSNPAQSPASPRTQTKQPAAQPQPAPVAATFTPEIAAPPPPAPAPPAAPSYADMLKQASVMLGNKQYTEAQTLLNKAIAANPAAAQAYNAIAKIELYYLNRPAQAFDHYRAALAKGGVAALRVSLDRAEGWLSISRGNAGFKADDGVHSFDTAAVIEAKRNKAGMIKIGKARQAFHIRLANGQNYNFEPGSQDPGGEVDFILSVIGS